MPQKIAILGLGWFGLPLAKALFESGYEITGSTTSTEKLMGLLQSRFAVRIVKVRKNNVEGNWKNFIKDADTLIINIPPDREDNPEVNYPLQIQQIAKRCDKNQRVIFISSTSVYGNDNQTVTEESDTVPVKSSGRAVLEAEAVIRETFGDHATILRFAGLYGEDRHPGRFIKPGRQIPNPEGYINLIHQDDCIQLVRAVLEKNCYGEIINGCADNHPDRKTFYNKAAYALSVPPPDFDDEIPSEWKIVSNQKSKDLLGISYTDPMAFLEN